MEKPGLYIIKETRNSNIVTFYTETHVIIIRFNFMCAEITSNKIRKKAKTSKDIATTQNKDKRSKISATRK